MNKNWLSLYILHVLNDGYRATFLVLLPFIAKDLFLPFSQVGLLGSTIGLITTCVAIPGGYIAGKIGGYKILLYSLLLYSCALIFIAFSRSIWVLVPLFFIGGAGFGVFHTISFTLVSQLSHETKIGTQLANFTAIGDIGRVSIPVITLFFVAMYGWKNVSLVLACIGIIIFVILRIISGSLMEMTSKEEISEHPVLFLKNLLKLFQHKRFLIVTVANVLDLCAYNSMNVFLPFLLLAKGATASTLGIFTGAFFAGSFIGKTILGRLVDIIGYKKVYFISEFCMALSLLLLTMSSSTWILFVFSLIVGIFTKGTSPVIQTMVSKTVQQKHHIKGYAINETVAGITITIAPLMAGIWADRYGVPATFYLAAGFALLAIVPVLFYSHTFPRTNPAP